MTLSDLLRWSGEHAGLVVWLCLFVGGGGLVLVAAYRVALAIAVLRAWWRGGSWLGRAGHPGHPGGAGGSGGHYSSEYQAVMQSAGWRRRRAHAIRRAGRRCQECGARGSLDVHHTTYAHLGDERPYELAVLCPTCHQAAHQR